MGNYKDADHGWSVNTPMYTDWVNTVHIIIIRGSLSVKNGPISVN